MSAVTPFAPSRPVPAWLASVPGRSGFVQAFDGALQLIDTPRAFQGLPEILAHRKIIAAGIEDIERSAAKLDLEPPRLIQARLAHSQAMCAFTIALQADQDADRELQDLIDDEPTGIRRFLGRFSGSNERYAQRIRKAEAAAAKARKQREAAELNRTVTQQRTAIEESTYLLTGQTERRQHKQMIGRYRAELEATALAGLAVIRHGGCPVDPRHLIEQCRQEIQERSRAPLLVQKEQPAQEPAIAAPRLRM